MRYLKRFESYENKEIEEDLKSTLNLIMNYTEVQKVEYSYYGSKRDFDIYVVSGVRSEQDDHKLLQEIYQNHDIFKEIYGIEIYCISLSKKYATIVLYDYLDRFGEKNYLGVLRESKLRISSDIKSRLNPLLNDRKYTKGISYSDGSQSNLSLFPWIYD